jgi:hypothetical protein
MSCLSITIGAIAGIFVGFLAAAFLGALTGSDEVAITGGFIACVWVGGNIGDGSYAKYFKIVARHYKTRRNGISPEDLVEVHFVNSKGIKRSLKVARHSARLKGDFVITVLETGATINLKKTRILNPEVLGLSKNPQNKDEVVSRDCPNCSNGNVRAWQGEMRCWNCGHVLKEDTPEPLPPVLTSPEPMPPTISAEPVVVLLQYLNRRGQEREIRVEAKAYMDGNSMIHCYLADSNGTLVLKQEQILNSSVLILRDISEMPTEEEEPPILEPYALELGDPSGRKLLYNQSSGKLAVIYFDPASVEIVGNRANLSPMGMTERYAIALKKIINPEVLEDEPELEAEEMPPVLSTPEALEPQLPIGTRVLIRRVPTDSYEAVQVMRRLKPRHSTFEIFEMLEDERLTTLTGYDHDEAIRVGGELEAVGCTVDIKRDKN